MEQAPTPNFTPEALLQATDDALDYFADLPPELLTHDAKALKVSWEQERARLLYEQAKVGIAKNR